MKWFKFLIAFFVLATTVVADEQSSTTRVISNPVLDGNLVLRVNDDGTPTDALTVDGATGRVKTKYGPNFGDVANVWSTGAIYPIDGLGQLYTHGSFAVSLLGNGYRNNAGFWTTYNANSQLGASRIELFPTGTIEFGTNATKNNGDSTSVTTRMSISNAGVVDIPGSLTLGTELAVAEGGLGGLSKTDGNFVVANGSTWVAESGATARTSLGLGSLSTLSAVSGGTGGTITDSTIVDDDLDSISTAKISDITSGMASVTISGCASCVSGNSCTGSNAGKLIYQKIGSTVCLSFADFECNSNASSFAFTLPGAIVPTAAGYGFEVHGLYGKSNSALVTGAKCILGPGVDSSVDCRQSEGGGVFDATGVKGLRTWASCYNL